MKLWGIFYQEPGDTEWRFADYWKQQPEQESRALACELRRIMPKVKIKAAPMSTVVPMETEEGS